MRYSAKRRLLHLFFPSRCPVCGEIIGAMDRFCPQCSGRLVSYEGEFSIDGADSFTAAYEYDDNTKPAIFLLKDGICGNAAYALGGALADALKKKGTDKTVDIIVPAPMYRRDIRRRGFNQSALIAREVGRILGIPTDLRSVVKIRRTHTQKGLSGSERKMNLKNAFSAADCLSGRNVLLIDDICTTGSTLREVTAAIKKAGAASVHCACCCKTISHKD